MIPADIIATWIQLARISQYLSADDNAQQAIMQWGPYRGNKRIPFLLGLYADTVEWAAQYYVGTEALDIVATYMYTLCGKYLARANAILGNATGIIVIPGTSIQSTMASIYIQFTIGDSGSPMNAGDTEYTVDYKFILANSLRAETVNANLPENDDTQVSYNVALTDDNAVITFNQGVQNGETYIITGLRFVPTV